MRKQLILENGQVFIGEGFGADKEMSGEVVFKTGMTGYQEALTDPSNCGQIVTMTYPLVGNAGMNRDDFQSFTPAVHGIIVKEFEDEPSHWLQNDTLGNYLKEKGIPGLAGIDTRKLTRLIREQGSLRGRICPIDVDVEAVVTELSETTLPTNQVEQVSTKAPYHAPGRGNRVVLVDLGVKHGVLQALISRECDVIVVPYNVSAEEIIQLNPDGIMLSNGPGNPADLEEVITVIKQLIGQVPIFGISLGYQLLAISCGATTSKLLFGHRGTNHPVLDIESDKVIMTTQNHGYTVDIDSLQHTELEVTHTAVNDETVEGIKHKTAPAFGVQFHPNGSPGPSDSSQLYDRFNEMMHSLKQRKVMA